MPKKQIDPARKYGIQDGKNKTYWRCIYCHVLTCGGVFRLKQHLIGGFRNATACKLCPKFVKEELKRYIAEKEEAKHNLHMAHPIQLADDEDDGEEVNDIQPSQREVRPQQRVVRGPLDRFVSTPSLNVLQARKNHKRVFGAFDKEAREKTCRGIARWFYDAGVSFNVVSYESSNEMIQLIGQYGPDLKPPSMHELRVLQKEVDETHKMLVEYKKEWASKGCSIMSDGWRDSVVQKDIINFLVNSPKGSVFIKSNDVSDVVKDATLLYQMLDAMVEEVREKMWFK